MLFIAFIIALASVITLAHATPSSCEGTFCADVKEVLYVNGTISSSQTYNLCMDVTTLNWKKTDPSGAMQLLDTPNNKFYSVNRIGECTVSAPAGIANPTQMPFSMMAIDQMAHYDGEGTSPDSNIKSVKYYHDRPSTTSGGVKLPSEQMYWYVNPTSTSGGDKDTADAYRMVESVCGQTYGQSPGDGGDSTTQSGNRDFATNYNTKTGGDPTTYTLPSDMNCKDTTSTTTKESVLFQALF